MGVPVPSGAETPGARWAHAALARLGHRPTEPATGSEPPTVPGATPRGLSLGLEWPTVAVTWAGVQTDPPSRPVRLVGCIDRADECLGGNRKEPGIGPTLPLQRQRRALGAAVPPVWPRTSHPVVTRPPSQECPKWTLHHPEEFGNSVKMSSLENKHGYGRKSACWSCPVLTVKCKAALAGPPGRSTLPGLRRPCGPQETFQARGGPPCSDSLPWPVYFSL